MSEFLSSLIEESYTGCLLWVLAASEYLVVNLELIYQLFGQQVLRKNLDTFFALSQVCHNLALLLKASWFSH
jgi:hypothetical protein